MDLNKVLKMNQDISKSFLEDSDLSLTKKKADMNISASMELLYSLGKAASIEELSLEITKKDKKLKNRPILEEWDKIVNQANESISTAVVIEDIVSESEIKEAFQELDEINRLFSRKTTITNKTDLSFLAIAVAIQVSKSLIFPHVAEKFHYGESFDKSERLNHNDKSIEQAHRKSNSDFRDKKLKKHEAGHWINILYQTPAYDITKGSKDLTINMGGAYHRMYTLGHDPVLGWVFGTMNILTDVITLNTFKSYRIMRNPMKITNEVVPIGLLFEESYEWIKDDPLNLPAAIFAQAQHLKSDEYTKIGLPIPILSSVNEILASKLYKKNYDAICLARDLKVVGSSLMVSRIFDTIISLVHGFFRKEDELKDLYEVRTRKILLISNSIASTSTIINAKITSNPKNLDIGMLLNTVAHLFMDIRFIEKIKQEFIETEISDRLKKEIDEIDRLYEEI
ncbi:hypothetical protein [Carnobacterium sp. TMP28]|uniref:hypothetical protein n=1 Tax=Carnobacterium sp. TMP28 TaxID=3397060 RepID=UPI0039E14618